MNGFEVFMLDKGMKLKNGYLFFRDRFELQGEIYSYKDIVYVETPYHSFKNKLPKKNGPNIGSLHYKIHVSSDKETTHSFNMNPHNLCVDLFLSESAKIRRKKIIDEIIEHGFFDYGSYQIYADGTIEHDGKTYNIKNAELKNGVYVLERRGLFSQDLELEINDNYDVVLELLNDLKNSNSNNEKRNDYNSLGGSEMELWNLFKGAASSMLDLKDIQCGADKVLLEAGFNILTINRKVRQAANEQVKEYFINTPNGTSITYYEAAMLKICLIYQLAKEVGDVGLQAVIENTEEKLQTSGDGKIRGHFYVQFHCL